MKLIKFAPLLAAGYLIFFANFSSALAEDSDAAVPEAQTSIPPWSIVGRWTCTTPDGTDTLNIRLDGSFTRAKDGESGKWTLAGTQDRVVLTLGWDKFPQTTLSLIKADEFRGIIHKHEDGKEYQSEMVLDRMPPVADFGTAQPQQSPKPGAPEKSDAAPAGPDTGDKLVAINLLDKAEHDAWSVETGNWGFDKDGLTGTGDSKIHYTRKIPTPFRLTFDLVVLDGMRPRLFLGKYSFANEGYSNTFALFPENEHTKRVPYELKKKYSIQIDATDKSMELRINGNVVDSRDTGIDTIQELIFEGGDWWSPGSTCFSNIILTCHAPEVEHPKKRPTPTPTPPPEHRATPDKAVLQT